METPIIQFGTPHRGAPLGSGKPVELAARRGSQSAVGVKRERPAGFDGGRRKA